MTSAAIRVVTDLAHDLGVTATPVVVADRSNLVLRLDPHPLVARVAMATSAARVGMAWLAREVEIARFLGPALSTSPAEEIDAGPHERDGLVISFWRLETMDHDPRPRDAGLRLGDCHRALAPYTNVPRWGAFLEARAVRERITMPSRDLARVDRMFDRAERILEHAESRTGSMQAIHGDAHLGNVLGTARGALWTDWEDAFLGPIEYDLACLRSKADLFGESREAIDAAYAAYDVPHDRTLVHELGQVRNVQVVVWLALFAERQPELLPRMRARLALLPE